MSNLKLLIWMYKLKQIFRMKSMNSHEFVGWSRWISANSSNKLDEFAWICRL